MVRLGSADIALFEFMLNDQEVCDSSSLLAVMIQLLAHPDSDSSIRDRVLQILWKKTRTILIWYLLYMQMFNISCIHR